MVKIRQAIVVEGKYDQNTLSQLVDTTIFQTRGFGVMRDKALLEANGLELPLCLAGVPEF